VERSVVTYVDRVAFVVFYSNDLVYSLRRRNLRCVGVHVIHVIHVWASLKGGDDDKPQKKLVWRRMWIGSCFFPHRYHIIRRGGFCSGNCP